MLWARVPRVVAAIFMSMCLRAHHEYQSNLITMSALGHDVSRRICPHCSKSVSFKTYKAHRRLFYDSSEDQWLLLASEGTGEAPSSTSEEEPPRSFGEILCGQDSHGSHMDSAPSQNYHDVCK